MKLSKYLIVPIVFLGCKEQNENFTKLPNLSDLNYTFNNLKNDHILPINVDTCEIRTFPKATEFIDSYKLLRLNTPPSLPVGAINKVLVTDKSIFVVDNQYTQQVFVFDHNGNFKNLVGRKGEAPGQYEDIVDVSITENTIFILDMGMRIFKYDVEDFSFKSKIDLPINGNAIYPISDSSILISSHDNSNSNNNYIYHLQVNSITQGVIQHHSKNLISIAAAPFGNTIDKYSLFAPAYSHQVYAINHLGAAPYLSLQFGADTIPNHIMQSKNLIEEIILQPKKSYSYIINSPIIQTDAHILLRASHKGNLFTYFINKNSGETKAYTGITDNMFLGGLSDFALTAWADECIYVLDPEPMQNYWKALSKNPEDLEIFRNENPSLFTILQQIKENENPMLIFAKLKD